MTTAVIIEDDSGEPYPIYMDIRTWLMHLVVNINDISIN